MVELLQYELIPVPSILLLAQLKQLNVYSKTPNCQAWKRKEKDD